jgi:hypothetical protein
MECALVLRLTDRPRLLEQIRLDVGAGDVAGSVEVDANELALESKGRISERIARKTAKELTNLDELSFFTVLALPKASRMGFACNNCCSSSPC